MMRSLYSGVSGLQNHQTRMDVIGNNISNVNTTGFKRGRVQFQDMISIIVKIVVIRKEQIINERIIPLNNSRKTLAFLSAWY